MVSGTYVLTDTIKSAFSTRLHPGLQEHRRRRHRQERDRQQRQRTTPSTPSLPQSLLTKVQALPGVAAGAGGIADSAQLVGRNGKVISRGGAPGLAFSVTRTAPALQPADADAGTWPSGPTRSRSTRRRPTRSTSRSGNRSAIVARGPVREVPHRRHRQVRRRLVARRRDDRDLRPADRAATLPQGGPARLDRRRRQARRHARAAGRADHSRCCRRGARSRPAQQQAAQQTPRTRTGS